MYVKKLCVTEIRSSTTYTPRGTNDFNKANGEEIEKKNNLPTIPYKLSHNVFFLL